MRRHLEINENLRRKRKILTKCLVFTIFLNIFLQFDLVEDYFSPSPDTFYGLVEKPAICGHTVITGSDDSDKRTELLVVASSAATYSSSSIKALNHLSLNIFLERSDAKSMSLYQENIYLIPAKNNHSGRSPPIALFS